MMKDNNGFITVEKSVTDNLGNYSAAKVTVGMTLPIDFTPEQLAAADAAMSVIIKTLDARLLAERKKLGVEFHHISTDSDEQPSKTSTKSPIRRR
jgi:hypothetical protein